MNEKDLKPNWKRNDHYGKKDYMNISNNVEHGYDVRNRDRDASSSRSRKFSRSRSRSFEKDRRKDNRRRRSMSMSRSRSPSIREESPRPNLIKPEKGPALNFMIFLSKSIETSLTSAGILKKIEDQLGDVKLIFQYDFTIPDLDGCVLNIKSEDIRKKKEACQNLLEFITKNDMDEPSVEAKKHSDKISVLVLVPNGLISMIIGTKGRQISTLIRDSGANIVVNQPIYKMMHRTIAISGKPSNVASAIMMIQTIMEDRYYEVSKVEMEFKPLNVTITQTHVKLVMSEDCVEALNSKRGAFINQLRDNYNVILSFFQDRKNRQLDRRDYIASIKGTIECVQDALILIIKKVSHYIRTTFDGRESYSLKMLINKVYVTKLIGAGGCMIQEIASFAGGASIKILSSRMDEKRSGSCHDIIVCIAGSAGAIQDASCIIIEQMECFKKGGPVLKSGKNLNQNIAQQFINSIFCSGGRKEGEEEHTYTLKDRFATRKRSKSRSRSRTPRSRSHERSHSKERRHRSGRSRHDDMGNNAKQAEKEHTNHNNHSHTHHKNDNFDLDSKDPSNNTSYDEKGVMKISNDIIVPDYLVSLLIGKSGETIRSIMNKSGSMITFQKEYNDEFKINTTTGVLGRVCNIKGTAQQNSLALQLISEMIIKLETSLNGVRKEN